MEFWGDERGQPVQIGFILLFGILVLAFAGYQGYVVPNQNAEIEFQHNQKLDAQFSELRSNVVNAVESGNERSTTLTLGTNYPPRLLALNPVPATGTLRTTEPREVELDADDVDIGDLCGPEDGKTYARSLVYSPEYSEHRNAGNTIYEHTFIGKSFADGGAIYGEQRLVGDSRIDLLLLNGSVSETRTGAYAVDVNASRRSDSVTVDQPTVTLPSQFAPGTWKKILEGTENVRVSDSGDGRVEIRFEQDDVQITCAVAGLNSEPKFSPPEPAPETDAADSRFDTKWIDGEKVTVEPGDVLGVEVTDHESIEHVQDATVDFAVEGGAVDEGSFEENGETDDEGRTTVTIPEQVEDGDEFDLYASTGDDTAMIAVEVVEEEDVEITAFETTDVTDLVANRNDESQTLTFSLDGDLQEGEEVVIDLNEPQFSGIANFEQVVDYPDKQIDNSDINGSGTAELNQPGLFSAELVYTAGPGGDPAGTEVEVTVTGIEVGDVADESYDVAFENDDAGTVTETFIVNSD